MVGRTNPLPDGDRPTARINIEPPLLLWQFAEHCTTSAPQTTTRPTHLVFSWRAFDYSELHHGPSTGGVGVTCCRS
jgi:hypothetical protein